MMMIMTMMMTVMVVMIAIKCSAATHVQHHDPMCKTFGDDDGFGDGGDSSDDDDDDDDFSEQFEVDLENNQIKKIENDQKGGEEKTILDQLLDLL